MPRVRGRARTPLAEARESLLNVTWPWLALAISRGNGVYYLHSDDGTVNYVGEGVSREYGLGYRIGQNTDKCKAKGATPTKVGIISFGEADLPFALALERFLIRDLAPPCNDDGKA